MVAGRSRPPPTYLVDGGRDGGEGEQGLELLAGEVADADGLGQAQAVALLHGLPHAPRVERLEVLLHEGGRVPAGLHGNGPVDQVQVHVLHLEVAATSGNGVGYQEQISLSCASEAVSVNNTLLVDCCIAQATKKSSYCNEQRCTLLRSANSYGTVERNYRAHITCSFSGPINKIIGGIGINNGGRGRGGTVPERPPEGGEDPVGVRVGAPDLGGDEHLVARGDDPVAHGLADRLPDGRLGRVVRGGVQVAVPELDGAEHRAADGVRLRALHRRPEADARRRDGSPSGGAHGATPPQCGGFPTPSRRGLHI
jgi:hypothetical protein